MEMLAEVYVQMDGETRVLYLEDTPSCQPGEQFTFRFSLARHRPLTVAVLFDFKVIIKQHQATTLHITYEMKLD